MSTLWCAGRTLYNLEDWWGGPGSPYLELAPVGADPRVRPLGADTWVGPYGCFIAP